MGEEARLRGRTTREEYPDLSVVLDVEPDPPVLSIVEHDVDSMGTK